MTKSGPIVIVEDDSDDKDIFEDIVRELGCPNRIVWFERADEAYRYLESTKEPVFIIFSDINLPGSNGLEFKKEIDSNPYLRKKSIPFIFYSTSGNQQAVNEAYTQMTVQGFFKKDNDYDEIKSSIKLILEYWSLCLHPNTQ